MKRNRPPRSLVDTALKAAAAALASPRSPDGPSPQQHEPVLTGQPLVGAGDEEGNVEDGLAVGIVQEPVAAGATRLTLALESPTHAADPGAWDRVAQPPHPFVDSPTERNPTMNTSAQGQSSLPTDSPATVLSPSIAFSGELNQTGGQVMVMGNASGRILVSGADGRISIEPSARVSADLDASSVAIGGEFDGAIRADRVQTRRGTQDAPGGDAAALLGAQASAVGVFSSEDAQASLVVQGALQGEVRLQGQHSRVVVAGGARVSQVTMSADSIDVSGEVDGSLVARRSLLLAAGCVVQGSITCPAEGLSIQPGARVRAMLVVGEAHQGQQDTGSHSSAAAANEGHPGEAMVANAS